jgi:coenzyme Q-binding protein COQ10
MPQLSLSETVPYTTRQIFDLVADVGKYPEFLPWCRAARVTPVTENQFLGELVIAFKGFTEKYTSRVSLTPPEDLQAPARVDVVMMEGPFHHLENHWELLPAPGGGTQINLNLDFQFKSKILEMLIGGLFQRASEKMVHAFRERADALYGKA